MKPIKILLAFLLLLTHQGWSASPKKEFYSLRIYQLKTREQEDRMDQYLQKALLPALHRIGVPQAGVFKSLGNDTAATRLIYVLIPLTSFNQFLKLPQLLEKDMQYLADGKDYLDAAYNQSAYSRFESVLLEAFPDMPVHQAPALKSSPAERIYELRSYEGPTEKIHANKVQMFNQGGEVTLFKRLDFNAVFYAEVVSGSHMPNLMYMTSFENMVARDQHWKAFNDDPVWKKLVASPEYQHNVSKADIFLLHAAPYSDL